MISSVTRQPAARKVIVGVDTHKHVHVAVAVDILGTRLGDQSFVADSGGYQALITWAEIHGPIEAFGIEGTGSYGAGLAGTVRRAGHRVIEVNRGDRRTRRAAGAAPSRRSRRPSRCWRANRRRSEDRRCRRDGIRQTPGYGGEGAHRGDATEADCCAAPLSGCAEALQDLTDRRLLTRCATPSRRLDTPTASTTHPSGARPPGGRPSPRKSRSHDRHLITTTETSDAPCSGSAPTRRPRC